MVKIFSFILLNSIIQINSTKISVINIFDFGKKELSERELV